jgi:O-antigen/teichoic acid export membrane protein
VLFSIIAFGVLCSNLTIFVYGAVIHAHKRPWLLIIADLLGSIATITLSLLMIPPMAELGAALALAGGSITALAACAVISERLTPIPVPWRDIAVSLVTSLATGVAAGLTAFVLHNLPVLIPLIAGGAAGAAMFLLMTWLFHPDAVRQFLAAALRRYARS